MERLYSNQQKAIRERVRRFTEREALARAAAIDQWLIIVCQVMKHSA